MPTSAGRVSAPTVSTRSGDRHAGDADLDVVAAIGRARDVEQVDRADEVGDEHVGRRVVDLLGRAELADLAGAHHGDAIAERQRLVLVVGDEDRRHRDLPLQRLQPHPGPVAQLGVEVGERLVEQQQARRRRQRPGQRDALLLAARQLVRVALGQVAELDELQHLAHPLLLGRALDPPQPERVADVLGDGHVRPDRVRLEHDAALPLLRRHERLGRAVEHDAVADRDAAGVGAVQAGDRPQRRRLPAPARAEQRQQLAGVRLQRDRVERDVIVERLRQSGDLQIRHSASLPTTAGRGRARRR